MNDQEAFELLRRANPVRVDDLDIEQAADIDALLRRATRSGYETQPIRDHGRRTTWLVVTSAVLVLGVVAPFAEGAFDHVRSWIGGGGAVVGVRSGAKLAAIRANGIVTSAAPDGHGGWFVSGGFTRIQGQPRAHLAHILRDGRLDPRWRASLSGPSPARYIWATLLVRRQTVYVAGAFHRVDGHARGDVVALNATTGRLVPRWRARVRALDGITSLALVAGRLVVGGVGALAADGHIRHCAIALRASDGAFDRGFHPRIAEVGDVPCVSAMAVVDDRVYVGGIFTAVDGVPRQGLAALHPATGSLINAFHPPRLRCRTCRVLHLGVTALAASHDRLFVGGLFTSIGGVARRGLAAFDPATGQVIPSWRADVQPSSVLGMVVVGDRVYLGGAFRTVAHTPRRRFAAVSAATGRVLPSWSPSPRIDYLLALALSRTRLLAAGAAH